MKKILIVEDDIVVRETLSDLLESEGYSVIEAQNALVALLRLKEDLPDLIICDIMMPLMDGYQFFKRVQISYLEKNIPFIFLTAKTDLESREMAMEMGADDFITKPYNPEKLIERIQKRLLRKEAIDKRLENLTNNIALYIPHELRTPLIPILGFTDMLLADFNSFTDSEKIDMIASIKRGAQRLYSRVEKFNLYSELKIEELQNEYLIEKDQICNPALLKDKIIKERNYYYEDRINDIRINLESQTLEISDTTFRNIFLELYENACKFSEIGTPIIINGKAENGSYNLSFENYGEEFAIHEIGEFYQKNRKLSQQVGNGLGLAIVKMLSKKYSLKFKINFEKTIKVIIEFPMVKI